MAKDETTAKGEGMEGSGETAKGEGMAEREEVAGGGATAGGGEISEGEGVAGRCVSDATKPVVDKGEGLAAEGARTEPLLLKEETAGAGEMRRADGEGGSEDAQMSAEREGGEQLPDGGVGQGKVGEVALNEGQAVSAVEAERGSQHGVETGGAEGEGPPPHRPAVGEVTVDEVQIGRWKGAAAMS
jgi:hypothetical protein